MRGGLRKITEILLQKVRRAFHRVRHLRVYMVAQQSAGLAPIRCPSSEAHCKDHRWHQLPAHWRSPRRIGFQGNNLAFLREN
jgi:hypothetical protein